MEFSWIIYSVLVFNQLIQINCVNYYQRTSCSFHSLYQFGDSTSDTGNLIRVGTVGSQFPSARLPYGETFPGQPTGRWSDGLLITDFIAKYLKLPLINPYLERNASFRNGVNFAVAGSTALEFSFLAERGIQVPNYTAPLSLQLNWFRKHLDSVCSTPREREEKLRKAVVIVGDIGNNDIAYGFRQGKNLSEVEGYVPFIAEAIANGTREAILVGAKVLVVPGAFPLGCLPLFLSRRTTFPDNNLDNFGCLRFLNNLSEFLNLRIRNRLRFLRREFPDVVILYADNYNAFLSLLRRAQSLGFDPNSLLKSCCGIGGQYNYDPNRFCGSSGVPVCRNPAKYINWDGIHYTQEAHRRFSEILIHQLQLHTIPCSQHY